jgi:hypothetical protein
MELYTWMLGQRFVGVSVEYNDFTSLEQKLSLGSTRGLKLCPLGQIVDIIRNIVIPVKRKISEL